MPVACTLHENAGLAGLNTLRVAATARWLAELRSAEALPRLLESPAAQGPLLVLGEGSNVLFAGDFPGLVLRPLLTGLSILDDDGATARVRAEAGVGWDAFVDWTLARGLAGLENLALIPGYVGAAPIQNIGAYGVEVARSDHAVEAWDRSVGRATRLARDECAFGYRDSVFKREPGALDRHGRRVPARARRRAAARLRGLREELACHGRTMPTPTQVADAVRRLRRRKLPDPAVIGNAGSFFKNPVVDVALAARLRSAHPDAPLYPAGDGMKQAVRRVAHRALRLARTPRRRCRHRGTARAGAGQPRRRQRRGTVVTGAPRGRLRRAAVRRPARTRAAHRRRAVVRPGRARPTPSLPGAGVRHALPRLLGRPRAPFCSSSTEMLSGERTNAMRPSRGGRLIVTPWSISRRQAA